MFPNLDSVKTIALDTETYNPGMKKLGSAARRGGYICGVSIATEDKSWYFSLNHPDSVNIPEDKFYHWLKTLENKNIIGANLTYDLDYLQYKGFKPKKRIIDILLAEPLIDENQFRFNLNSCSKKYLGEEKKEPGLLDFCERNNLKITSEHPAQSYIYKMPAYQVEEYAKADSELAYKVWLKQYPILQNQDLLPVFDMESRLIPLMVQMKKTGVRIDEDKRQQNIIKYEAKIKEAQERLCNAAGFEISISKTSDIVKLFNKLNLPIVYGAPTKTGQINPVTNKNQRALYNHPTVNLIDDLSGWISIYDKYIRDIDKFYIGDRIHAEFKQLKADVGGTTTGRFSCSKPNLQNQPSKDPEKKLDCRSMYLPEDGCIWGRGDHSQIELRMLAHYARGTGAEEYRQIYIQNPKAKIHQICADMAGIKRKQAKGITFGVCYGSGPKRIAKELKMPFEQGKALYYQYLKKFPFLKKTSKDAEDVANKRGYVCTILGRKRRFPDGKGTYRALNAVLQGSASEVMKKGMVDCYEKGIFDVLPLHITLHDELDVSIPDTKEAREAWEEAKHICEGTIKLKVPLIFDQETGPNWGECK